MIVCVNTVGSSQSVKPLETNSLIEVNIIYLYVLDFKISEVPFFSISEKLIFKVAALLKQNWQQVELLTLYYYSL